MMNSECSKTRYSPNSRIGAFLLTLPPGDVSYKLGDNGEVGVLQARATLQEMELHAALLLLWNIWLTSCEESPQEEFVSHVEQLYKKLFSEDVYDKSLRPAPTENGTTATLVELSMPQDDICGVELEHGWLTFVGLTLFIWYDKSLSWNTSEYGGQNFLDVSANDVWTPDISVLNTNPDDVHLEFNRIYLSSEGQHIQAPYTRIKVPCAMDLTDFPRDKQRCTIRFASFGHTDEEVQYDTIADIAENGWLAKEPWRGYPWDVWVLPSWKDGYLLNRTYVEATIVLQRRFSEYLYSVTLPWISSAVLMLLVFCLPANSSRRLTLCCANLLLLALMLQRMTPLLSASYRPPKLMFYLESAMVLQAVITVIAVMFINLTSGHIVFPVAVPDHVMQLLTGAVGTALCLCPSSTTRNENGSFVPSGVDSSLPAKTATTRLSEERAKDWLLVSRALDRFFVVVFLVTLLCVMPL